jgi:hypothetical protein
MKLLSRVWRAVRLRRTTRCHWFYDQDLDTITVAYYWRYGGLSGYTTKTLFVRAGEDYEPERHIDMTSRQIAEHFMSGRLVYLGSTKTAVIKGE